MGEKIRKEGRKVKQPRTKKKSSAFKINVFMGGCLPISYSRPFQHRWIVRHFQPVLSLYRLTTYWFKLYIHHAGHAWRIYIGELYWSFQLTISKRVCKCISQNVRPFRHSFFCCCCQREPFIIHCCIFLSLIPSLHFSCSSFLPPSLFSPHSLALLYFALFSFPWPPSLSALFSHEFRLACTPTLSLGSLVGFQLI